MNSKDELLLQREGLSLRRVRTDEMEGALQLSAAAGWNQLLFDWKIFQDHGTVLGLFSRNAQLVATAATLPYPPRFAWISMVLVHQEWRRRGLASLLLRECMDRLRRNGHTAGLDATEAGSAVYRKPGFIPGARISRLYLENPVRLESGEPEAGPVLPWSESGEETVCQWDAPRFGADRRFLLTALAKACPDMAWTVHHADGAPAGFLLGRQGRRARQIGPLSAATDRHAIHLFNQAISQFKGPAYIDVPQDRSRFMEHLINNGWSVEREFLRMSTESDPGFGHLTDIFAIAGPELA